MSNNQETHSEAVKKFWTAIALRCFHVFVIDEFKLIHQIIFNGF